MIQTLIIKRTDTTFPFTRHTTGNIVNVQKMGIYSNRCCDKEHLPVWNIMRISSSMSAVRCGWFSGHHGMMSNTSRALCVSCIKHFCKLFDVVQFECSLSEHKMWRKDNMAEGVVYFFSLLVSIQYLHDYTSKLHLKTVLSALKLSQSCNYLNALKQSKKKKHFMCAPKIRNANWDTKLLITI